MDTTAIIFGISSVVFLLFYLAFHIDEKNKFLLIAKFSLIFIGLFIITYIFPVINYADLECIVQDVNITSQDYNYICYKSDGTLINATQHAGYNLTAMGGGLTVNYLNFLTYFSIYALCLLFGWLAVEIYRWWKEKRYLK